jgi:hypothetical protein
VAVLRKHEIDKRTSQSDEKGIKEENGKLYYTCKESAWNAYYYGKSERADVKRCRGVVLYMFTGARFTNC